MFLSMNWIGDFVDLSGLDKTALIRNFTLSTAEVEDIYIKGEDTRGVIVARILSVAEHPTSRKLHLLKVDTGKDVLDVVCGAPNVREGMKVAFATDGGAVAGNPIRTATVAGFPSHGMCCSEAELGISDDHSGLMEIFEDVPLGTDVKTIYDIDDIIFEVDNKSLTNRPDLWGHFGIAREFSAITGRPLCAPETVDTAIYDALPEVPIDVRSTDLVRRYTAVCVSQITRKVSPVNMRIRLFYCGSRAINFLADLTNYVMMELGQPMHAFDREIVDRIEVQTPSAPFVFRTLDGVDRNIDENMLLITSADRPVAIAGVMGGEASKIGDNTRSLLLESATFDGISVRKTTTRLGLRTDASMRYEKMLDPALCKTATERLLFLLSAYDSGARVDSRFSDCYVNPYPEITLDFDKAFVDRYTGIDISADAVEKTLCDLGFGVSRKADAFSVVVPSWRATKDVTIRADIIEEIARIYGYDNFAIRTSNSPLRPVRAEIVQADEDRMKDILVKSFRLHEVHSYIWSDARVDKELGIRTQKNVRVINAQTPEHQYLRTSMIPTLLGFVRDNRAFADSFGIFEIGHTVEGLKENGYCNEKKKLGVVLFSKEKNEERCFLLCRDMIAELCEDILHKFPTFARAEAKADYEHPANTFDIAIDGVTIGRLSVPFPTVAAAIDKKGALAFFEIETAAFAAVKPQALQYHEPSKFPAIDIDLTFLADLAQIDFDRLVEAAKGAAGDLLTDVRVHDIYTEDGSDRAALTLRFSFLSRERTLTKQELSPATDAILAAFAPLGVVFKG